MHRSASFLRTAAAALLLFVLPGLAAAAPLAPETLLDLEQVRAADLSPDGKLAAYTVAVNRSLDDEAGGAWSRLWVVDLEGGEPRPFISGEVSVGSPRFSPDGKVIGFTMSRGKDAKTQVWTIAVDGGEAAPATASKTGVGAWTWSHDGAHIFYVDADEAPKAEKTLKKKGWLPRYYEENLRGRTLRRAAYSHGAEPAEGEALVEGLAVWGVSAADGGSHLVFGASEGPLVDQRYMFQDVYLLDLATGEHRLAVDVPGKLGDYRLSPDGRRLAWTAAASQSDHAVSSLFIGDIAADGAVAERNITPEGFAGHIRHVTWRDDNSLLVQADEGVTTTAYAVAVSGKKPNWRKVIDGGEQDLVFGMPAGRPGRRTLLLVGHNGATPRELYAYTGKGAPQRLTRHNPQLADVALGEQRVVRWTARDGLELEGILMLPVDWDGKPAPLVLDIHGGPESQESNGWLSRYASPGQVLCGRGYAVLFPNYRGSTGRGVEFAALAFGDPAGAEFDDIVDAVDHLVKEGVADPARVGVMGGSYGGYATNWLCTKYSDRFAAGVSFVGVSDLVSKRFLTDIPYEDEYVHMGKPVRESWDLMLERSPVRYADGARTPLLILHGDSDPRVHPSQSQELYRALKMASHPAVRLVYYPGEGHGNSRRFGRADVLWRTLGWFDHYLAGGASADGPMPALDISESMGLPLDD
jgi:dipeptidyl aminopeptidase/acylaminoacyl peptidase